MTRHLAIAAVMLWLSGCGKPEPSALATFDPANCESGQIATIVENKLTCVDQPTKPDALSEQIKQISANLDKTQVRVAQHVREAYIAGASDTLGAVIDGVTAAPDDAIWTKETLLDKLERSRKMIDMLKAKQ